MARAYIIRADGRVDLVEVKNRKEAQVALGGGVVDVFRFPDHKFTVYGLRTQWEGRKNPTAEDFIARISKLDSGSTVVGYTDGVTGAIFQRRLHKGGVDGFHKHLSGFFTGEILVAGQGAGVGHLTMKPEELKDIPKNIEDVLGEI